MTAGDKVDQDLLPRGDAMTAAPGQRLRDAWSAGPIAVPGVFNALVARMAERLQFRAAVAARRDPSFVIVARTDARGVSGFDDAVKRARLYLEAGADAIFPEALESADEFARFAREAPATLVANMTEFGKSPNMDVK